jgi:hypothetical protein
LSALPFFNQAKARVVLAGWTTDEVAGHTIGCHDPNVLPRTLRLSLLSAPTNATSNASSGIFSWHPLRQPGSHDSTIARLTLASLGLAGAAPRTASLALYAIPERAAKSLMGIGALAASFLRRRKA